jgi:hypothetical protein
MPFNKLAIPSDLIMPTGDAVRLNSEKYPEFRSGEGFTSPAT